MDFIVKLPPSHGYDSIWVVCDQMTRAAHFIPVCESMDAPELARLFLDRMFRLHGFPQSIVTDCGSTFVSSFFTNLMKLCHVKMKPLTAYHPQTDGLTERTNRTLETYLRAFCSYQQDNWVDYLALAEFSFNNSINSSTRQTPFFANFGYHPVFDISLSERSTNPSAANVADCLKIIQDKLQAELAHSNDSTAEYYNRHHLSSPSFQTGDYVWLLRRNIKTTRPCDKLDFCRIGPFKILDKRNDVTYLLDLPSTLSRLHPVFHVSLLEKYSNPSSIPNCLPGQTIQPVLLQHESGQDVSTILNCRKVGRHYDYLIHWKDLPQTKDSWIPFAELPNSLFPILESFHCRNPSIPHPPCFQFSHIHSSSFINFDSVPSIPTTSNYNPDRLSSTPPTPWMRDYEPPQFQSTSSGCRIHPPASKDYSSITNRGVMS